MHSLSKEQADEAGFELLDVRSFGGSATVYKAIHKQSNRIVAVKLLNCGGNPVRIRREASTMTALNHPNIARVIGVGEIADTPYLATQWIEGTSMGQLVQQSIRSDHVAMSIEQTKKLVGNITDALQHAHDNGVIHGDINPNNILVSDKEEAVLIDFGISRTESKDTITLIGELAGTPRYLAPELIKGQSPDAASDQYALALLVYEMLTGHWPFSQNKPIAAVALHNQLYVLPTAISEIRPDLPATLDRVFSKALSKSPAQRFIDIRGFYDALEFATKRASTKHETLTQGLIQHNGTALWYRRFARIPAIVLSVAVASTIFLLISERWSAGGTNIPVSAIVGGQKSALEILPMSVSEAQDSTVTESASSLQLNTFAPLSHATSAIASKNHLLSLKQPAVTSVNRSLDEATMASENEIAGNCNLYKNASFDQQLEDNFFRDSDYMELATRVEVPDLTSSPVLQLGQSDIYGSYGFIISVVGGQTYTFGANLFFRQYVHRMEMRIIWLDEHWQTIPDEDDTLIIERKFDNSFLLSGATAPQMAHYAVPTLYKDASSGIVYADDVRFFPSNHPC